MKISEIVDELNNVSEWIDGVANSSDKEQEHIKNINNLTFPTQYDFRNTTAFLESVPLIIQKGLTSVKIMFTSFFDK